MRTMKELFSGIALVVLFCFLVVGGERAWATITTASNVASSANGSITIGTGGTLNVPLSAGITWPGSGLTLSSNVGFTGLDVNNTVNSTVASGSCGFMNGTAGAKVCVGPGANMDIKQDANTNISMGSGAAYVASATPFIDNVYVNNIPSAFIYGGGQLPAHAATIQAIHFYVRTAGSVGSTNAVFQVTDGTNTCNCSYACNQSTGPKHFACANGAGTGCVYAASASLTYQFTGVGDCAGTSADINGNISVEGIWQ